MKVTSIQLFIGSGSFAESKEYENIVEELRLSINEVTWDDDKLFKINPIKKGNGVGPIRSQFIDKLITRNWRKEIRMSLARGMNPGPIDAIKETEHGLFAVEWETGNISSSHRALNKIATGIIQKQIIGGFLILPIKEFSQYLTDRVGNYEELAPYIAMYENLKLTGVIGIISVCHDAIDVEAPIIPKGSDGNAK